MKKSFAFCVLMALVLEIQGAPVGEKVGAGVATRPAVGQAQELAALEKKLVREWSGPACGGDFKFNADGSFVCDSYTPAGCTLSGKWVVRWDALSPTLALMFEKSDWSKKFPGEEFKYLGKTLEVRILELDDEGLVFKGAKGEWDWKGRVKGKE